MISIIIADDERSIIELIKNLIDPILVEVNILGEAENGLVAYDLVIEKHPDVVITDIRMPGMTGIELIQKVRQENIEVSFIVVSGYREFEYAQTALKNGVTDYLLKPIKRLELNQLLQRLDSKKDKDSIQANKAILMEKKLAITNELLRKNALLDLFSEIPERNLAAISIFQNNDIFFHAQGRSVIGIIKLDSLKASEKMDFSLSTTEALVARFIRVMKNDCYDIEFSCKEAIGFFYILYGEEHKSIVEKCSTLEEIILNDTFKYSFFNITIGFGEVVENMEQLRNSYLTAVRSIRTRIDEGIGHVIAYDQLNEKYKKPEAVLTNTDKQKIRQCVENLDIESLQTFIDELFQKRNHIMGMLNYLVYGYSRTIIDLVFALLTEFNPKCEILSPMIAINETENCISVDEIKEICQDYMRKAMKECIDQKTDIESKPIRIIRQFIQENYNSPISLEEAAKIVHLNPIYVSTIFKREIGTSFTNYLTNVRIEEAKRFLRETNLSISEISGKVGYNDAKYFSKLFIKLIGIKPTEYRKFYS